jgi:hypothetical protein
VGFYIRKGFNFGPLRLNLSRSGLGASLGVKGARIGVGPRGSYIHVGRGGLYYRQSLGSPEQVRRPARPTAVDIESLPEIESGDVEQMVDASSAALLAELNRVHRRWDLFPLLLVLMLAAIMSLTVMACNSLGVIPWPVPEAPPARVPIADVLRDRLAAAASVRIPAWWWAGAAVSVSLLSVPLLLWARNRDVTRGTVVLRYDLEPEADADFTRLKEAFSSFAYSDAVWHVQAKGGTRNWKRHAGANTLVERQAIRPRLSQPHRVDCLAVPTLPAGHQTLYLFPDRVLVYERTGVGAVAYHDMDVHAATVRFTEEGNVPGDAQVVGSTWRYVNRDGGPDRRFHNNHEIPLVSYGELRIQSGSGLDELFQCSRSLAAQELADVLASQSQSARVSKRSH